MVSRDRHRPIGRRSADSERAARILQTGSEVPRSVTRERCRYRSCRELRWIALAGCRSARRSGQLLVRLDVGGVVTRSWPAHWASCSCPGVPAVRLILRLAASLLWDQLVASATSVSGGGAASVKMWRAGAAQVRAGVVGSPPLPIAPTPPLS